MNSPTPHPAWCDPDRCDVTPDHPDGVHCSRPVVLGPYPPGPVTAEVSAAQGPPVPGYPWSGRPYLVLTLRDGDTELCLVPLTLGLAEALGRILTGLAAEVAR